AMGLATFALALFGIAWWEFTARRIQTPEEVVHGLGLQVISTLPDVPASARTCLEPAGRAPCDLHWKNVLCESVDATRTLLLHAARVEGLRSVLVTSAVGGEGKTSLATQLAASLARAGLKTLLVDGDLRNPSAHRAVGMPLEAGFSELLRGEAKAAVLIRPTPVENLWLLPAGHRDAHAHQALAAGQAGPLFDQ